MICNKAHLSQHCLNFLNRDQSATAPKKGANKSLTNESGSVQSPENDFYFPVKPIRATKNSFKAESSLDHSSELRHTHTRTQIFKKQRFSCQWCCGHLVFTSYMEGHEIHPSMYVYLQGGFVYCSLIKPARVPTDSWRTPTEQTPFHKVKWPKRFHQQQQNLSFKNLSISSFRVCVQTTITSHKATIC